MPTTSFAYGVQSSTDAAAMMTIQRRDLQAQDVRIDIRWCGVCGTDLHQARNDWNRSVFPMVPGHEIVGFISEVGSKVKSVEKGDAVAVGCLVDSCGSCEDCDDHQEQLCLGRVSTYNSKDQHVPGKMTYGGYSTQVVVNHRFVIKIPKSLSENPEMLKRAAPIACAGITTWLPLKRFGCGPGKKVGVIGFGGLGHMAVKLAIAMGAEVTIISRSHDKADLAKQMGAHRIVASISSEEMSSANRSLDFIINTIPFQHDFNHYMPLLRSFGTMVVVGYIGELSDQPFNTGQLVFQNKNLAGSFIGGIKATQDLFNFCGENGITADVQIIKMSQLNDSWEQMKEGRVHFRFVIDITDFAENYR